eukprot:9468948-Alexandrium_andersonii.AAC.1
MSASLVGSEMCIRDRSGPQGHNENRLATRSGPREHVEDRLAARSGPQAVSYTHLTLPTICSV